MTLRIHALLPSLLLLTALCGNARAQKLSLSLHRTDSKGSFGITLGTGGSPAHCVPAPPVCHAPAGTWEVIEDKVWVPAREVRVWVEPVYETWYDHCGHAHARLVSAGHWKTSCEPGHWEVRKRKVWIPSYRPIAGIAYRWR